MSVFSALALLTQGAEKTTFNELVHGLHLGSDKSAIAANYATHYGSLNERAGEAPLSVANHFYVQQGYQIRKTFHDTAVNQFKSGIDSVNFVQSAAAAATINSFVESKTNHKIKDLIKASSLDADTRLVLVNAIHFKGEWVKAFKPYATSSGDFYLDETKTKNVDFMNNNEDYGYAVLKDLDATAVELKYLGSQFSFVVVLPNSKNGLSNLEATLQNYDLSKIWSQLHEEYVDVTLPKFKVEYEIELNSVLQKVKIRISFLEIVRK